MSVVTLNGRSGKGPGGGGDLKGINSLLKGQTVVGVEEDFTHAWTMLELAPSKMFVGVTMSDPVSSQMPLQPPTIKSLEGYTINRIRVSSERTVILETTLDERKYVGYVAMSRTLQSSLAERIAAFLHPKFSVALHPMLTRDVPYPVALIFLSSPTRPEIEGKGTLFQPQRNQWSPICPLPLPRPITAYAPPAVIQPDKKCAVQ